MYLEPSLFHTFQWETPSNISDLAARLAVDKPSEEENVRPLHRR